MSIRKGLLLILVLFVALLICIASGDAQEPTSSTPTPEFDHWVVAPLVQKAHVEPTPTITPTPWRPPPTPIPPCGCSGDLYDCTDFTTQVVAQACYDYCMQEVGYDVHKLDRDEDGIACEWLL